MKRLQTQLKNKLLVLALTPMLLNACAHGVTPYTETKMEPSADFLYGFAIEYFDGVYGPYTKAAIQDWITQNEPN